MNFNAQCFFKYNIIIILLYIYIMEYGADIKEVFLNQFQEEKLKYRNKKVF